MSNSPRDKGLRPSKRPLINGEHTADVNGVDLHYRVDGSGPPLIVVSPGWGVGSGYLQRGLAFLLPHFQVVFVDTRGSGLSDRPVDNSKMGSVEMADDLEALRQHLGLPLITLIGHSNGGAIALAFAQRHPDRISKLVLIDSQVLGFQAAEDTQQFLISRSKDSRYEHAVQQATNLFSGKSVPPSNDQELSAFVSSLLPLYLQHPEKHLHQAQKELLVGQVAFYAYSSQNAADALANNDHISRLTSIRAPVLILNGRHDWICPVATARKLHAGLENSTLVIFEGSGHLPWIEEPETFQAYLLQFL